MLARPCFSLKRIVIFLVAAAVLVSGGAFCLHVWLAARAAVAEGARVAASAGQAAVSILTLRPTASRFGPVLAASEFRSAVQFSGATYICGGSTLFEYSGVELKKTWQAGRELPAAHLLSLAVRMGIGTPELWMATDGAGVVVYDGNTFRQFLPESQALRKITALLPLGDGRVLLGTATAGLYISDGKSLRLFHPAFARAHITALAGNEDQFWIGTQADGVWLWRGGEALHLSDNLPDPQVLSLAFRGDQGWVGTPLGVAEFHGGKFTRHLADGMFAEALATANDTLYIGTIDQGTFAVPLKTQNPRRQASRVPENTGAATSFADLAGHLVAVQARELTTVEGHESLLKAPGNTLSASHITALQEDWRGGLWIGYFDAGLDVLPAGSQTPTHFEDDTVYCVNRIQENPQDNSLWAATANGLAVFDTGGRLRQVLTSESGLIASNVTDILFPADPKSGPSLVVATPAGLSLFDHGSFSSVYAFQGLVNNHVYTLAMLDGTLYAGTLGGLSSLREGLVKASYNTGNSPLRQNWITGSAVFGGHLYLGTYGSGVVRFDDGNAVQTFPSFEHGRVEINLNALVATDRALYAGTAGAGLAILRHGEEGWQFVSEGLPSLNVTALAARAGRLSIGTDNGLVRISENDLLP